MQRHPLLLLLLFAATMATVMATIQFTGTNLSGGEFGNTVPGTFGTDYTYPTTAEVDYFVSAGMNTFRVPFLWQRLQHNIGDSFDTAEVGRLTTIINYITNTKGAYAILDPHDYARYKGNVIGGGTVSDADFASFWSTLAGLFADNNKVFFNLVNEPHDMPTEQWLSAAQAAVNAIRAVPANNLVMVPGNGYTGAWKWLDNYYGTPNSKVMINFTDPGNNFVFEVHQYSDTDGSGTSEVCVSSTIGQERLVQFTQWLRTNNRKGFLGEFAGGNNSVCQTAMNGLLQYMKDNDDVWIGWTWWSAGPWWGQYMYSIEPGAPANWYLTNVLAKFLGTPQTTTTGNQGSSTSSAPSGSTSAGSHIAPFWL